MKNILKYQLPPVLWALVLSLAARFPDLFSIIAVPPGPDKIVHAGVYFILCWLVDRALRHQEALPQLRDSPIFGAFIFCSVYGILDEFHQSVLPGRTASLFNLAAGVGGSVLYVALAILYGANRHGGGSSDSES